jgi:hypothetical protein
LKGEADAAFSGEQNQVFFERETGLKGPGDYFNISMSMHNYKEAPQKEGK